MNMSRSPDAYIATHPLRFKLLRSLAEEPLNADKLAGKLDLSGNLVYFHLATLQQYGFVETSYTLGNPPDDPRAVLQFDLTDEGRKLIDKLATALA